MIHTGMQKPNFIYVTAHKGYKMPDPIWQSACLDCPPELRNYDSERCKKCERPTERLKEIGGLASPAPMKSVKGESMQKNVPDIPNMYEVVKTAQAICKASGIDYSRELMTKLKDKKIVGVRRHVIITLCQKSFGLSNGQVANFLQLSQQYVSHVINHHKYTMSTQNPEIKVPVGDKEDHILAVNFNGQGDLLSIVKQLAAKELRPVPLQLLHMIKSQAQLLFAEYELDKGENSDRSFGL